MSILFVDSSALVKRYQEEEGSDRVSELTENAHGLLIARLTIVEVSSGSGAPSESNELAQL